MLGEKSFWVYISAVYFIFLSFFHCIRQIDLEVLPVIGLQMLSLGNQPIPNPNTLYTLFSFIQMFTWYCPLDV